MGLRSFATGKSDERYAEEQAIAQMDFSDKAEAYAAKAEQFARANMYAEAAAHAGMAAAYGSLATEKMLMEFLDALDARSEAAASPDA